MEYAAVVWHSSLTRDNISDIERVQKCALSLILGKKYINYENVLNICQLKKLCDRRETLCITFAEKSSKSDKFFSCWFVADETPEHKAGTTSCKTSAVKNLQVSKICLAIPHQYYKSKTVKRETP